MNPEIEPMLEDALADLQPHAPEVGRVDVEPDYELGLTADEIPQVRQELEKLLSGANVDHAAIASHAGQALELQAFPMLQKYLRKVSLHAGSTSDSWVDVVPPGNWI